MNIINRLKSIFHFDNLIVFYLVPVWLFTLCARIYKFNNSGSTNYGNITDSIIYPALATLFVFLLLKLFKNGFLKKVILNQLVVLYVYVLFLFSNLDLRYICVLHIILALFVSSKDIIEHFNISKKLYSLLLFSFCIVFLFIHNTQNGIFSINNNKQIYDSFSEGISYNSALYYYNNPSEISKYYFLPIIKYPNEPFHIIVDDPNLPVNNFSSKVVVYTHYPAGSDIINYLLISIIGPSNNYGPNSVLSLDKYRFFPLIVFFIGFIFLRKFLFLTIKNEWLSYLLALLILIIPAFDRYKLSLYYYSYAFSLMLIMYYATAKYFSKLSKKYLVILLIIAIIQMWFSFDLLPMILLSIFSISILFITPKLKSYLLKPSITVFQGYILGFIMRLIHNNLYYKNISDTITELINTFLWRSTGTYAGMEPSLFYIDQVLKKYNNVYIPSELFFGLQIQVFAFILLALLLILSYYLKNNRYRNMSYFLLFSIFASYIWIYIMRNHGAIHYFVLTRQFIPMIIAIFIVISILLIDLVSFSKNIKFLKGKDDKTLASSSI